jgi:uncharacterized phage-associated protein
MKLTPSVASALDVATYILTKTGPLTAMKLQKLVYYCQAWSLVWDERALFAEPIQAWKNGPVVRALYDQHAGRFLVNPGDIPGNLDALDAIACETIDAVLAFYGAHTAQWLSDLTHAEDPWKKARAGHTDQDNSEEIISLESMHRYYSNLPNE